MRIWNKKLSTYDYVESLAEIGTRFNTIANTGEENYVIERKSPYRDLNDKFLYEGDIIEAEDIRLVVQNGPFWTIYMDRYGGYDGWHCTTIPDKARHYSLPNLISRVSIKYLGNIHENPELIK